MPGKRKRRHTQFDITLTARRAIRDFELPGDDDMCRIHPSMIVGSPYFHWFELTTVAEILRIEAVRANPQPRRSRGRWEWDRPDRFRVRRGDDAEYELGPKEILDPGQRGIDPRALWIYDAMRSPAFVSFRYAVGRRVVQIAPHLDQSKQSDALGVIDGDPGDTAALREERE